MGNNGFEGSDAGKALSEALLTTPMLEELDLSSPPNKYGGHNPCDPAFATAFATGIAKRPTGGLLNSGAKLTWLNFNDNDLGAHAARSLTKAVCHLLIRRFVAQQVHDGFLAPMFLSIDGRQDDLLRDFTSLHIALRKARTGTTDRAAGSSFSSNSNSSSNSSSNPKRVCRRREEAAPVPVQAPVSAPPREMLLRIVLPYIV